MKRQKKAKNVANTADIQNSSENSLTEHLQPAAPNWNSLIQQFKPEDGFAKNGNSSKVGQDLQYNPPQKLKSQDSASNRTALDYNDIHSVDWKREISPKLPEELSQELRDKILETVTGHISDITGELVPVVDEYGLPLTEKEIEVKRLLDANQEGTPLLPKYSAKDKRWESPLDFLEKVYGRYLSIFPSQCVNGENTLYLPQLRKLDTQLVKRLRDWLVSNEALTNEMKHVTYFVPSKTEQVAEKISKLERSGRKKELQRLVNQINQAKYRHKAA